MEPTGADFFLIFSLASVGMLLLAGVIILFVIVYQKRMLHEQFKRQQLELDHQRKMMEAALESQENERRRIAADLHDSIGAMLSTIRVSLITLSRSANGHVENINESKKMLDDTIESVRRISRDLMPSTLEKFGLLQAIKEICERFETTSTVPIHFEHVGDFPALEKNRELMVFRIAQELLNNALKHSKADSLWVRFGCDLACTLEVEDDGVGFDPEIYKNDKGNDKGLGLFNMENRARLLGGNLSFEKGRKKGSKVLLTIPLQK